MMPDYGCFTIAWTSYGIVVPLIEHVFGIQPDAIHRTVVFDPHVPTGWEDMSHRGSARRRQPGLILRGLRREGDRISLRAKEDGWRFVFKKGQAGTTYYLNGKPGLRLRPPVLR